MALNGQKIKRKKKAEDIGVTFVEDVLVIFVCACVYMGHSPKNWTKDGATFLMK